MESSFEFLRFVQSKDLSFWDVKTYSCKSVCSQFVVIKLKDYLTEQNKKEKLFKYPNKYFKILGVNNQNGLFDAYEEQGKNINQPYKKVEDGWFAYNPYRVNVGSIGLKSAQQNNEYISPAYVVFSCKNALLPDYLNVIIKANTTGSVRQTLGFNNLCNIEIPLPSIERQKELVAQYNALLNLAKDKENQAKEIEKSIDDYLMVELGIENNFATTSQNLFQVVNYTKLDKWELNKKFILSAKYNLVDLDKNASLFTLFKRGKSPKYQEHSHCYAINQKCIRLGYIDLQYKKFIDDKWNASINMELKTKIGDILINSTGEGTIGRAAIVDKECTDLVYDSHILNLRLNSQYIYPLYFVKIFNSFFVQRQIDFLKSGTSTKQTELGVENAKKILIPLPPLNIQNKIVQEITSRNKQIQDLQEESEKLRSQALSDFEKEVFN